MNKTRLQIAKKDIETFFFENPAKIFTFRDLGAIFNANREFWRLRQDEILKIFIQYLIDKSHLQKVVLKFPHRKETRYTWGKVDILKVLMEINPKSYFSHLTALYLQDLTEQIPKTIYLNTEQTPKPANSVAELQQSNIDLAFSRKARVTKNIANYKGQRILHLSGKNTNNLGVVMKPVERIGEIRTTNIERTLLDCTVRPVYSGGVFETAKAFFNARDTLSVNKLLSYLKKINYIYPYHQAIGFYLERAGYKKDQIELLDQFPIAKDFYLDHAMQETDYDAKWRIYYPKGM